MHKGIIFNIQKFSIHDGPGIRTTVFLKGCPLRCKWCANPESQMEDIQILYDQKNCKHCLTCVQSCPKGALKLVKDKIEINQDLCIGCITCVKSCYYDALSYEGEQKIVDEVVKICMQDIDFYEESNGGVTISGGEGMSQPVFLKELIQQLHVNNVHVAIETTGYIKEEIFQELASELDLLLFDVKHYDPNKHHLGTGVDNELILKNLKWAYDHHIEVLPRIPVIPAFNDSLEDAKGLAILIKSIGGTRVQLLPFHQFGERKYELLNKEYAYKNVKAYHQEDLLDYQKVFIDEGINCFF